MVLFPVVIVEVDGVHATTAVAMSFSTLPMVMATPTESPAESFDVAFTPLGHAVACR